MSEKTTYLTTPIYYVNGAPHIGSALTTLCCDFLARYHRLQGRKVWLLTGTDEQATKVVEAAQKAGVETQAFVDGLAAEFKSAWHAMHIEYDDFIRTTEARHVEVVQEVFTRLLAKGDIYKDLYEGWYCVADETYFRDTDVGEDKLCPNAECRQPLRRVQQENYFFRLSAYADHLLKHIESNPGFLQPEFRKNEVIGFIKQGLRDMSITRAGGGWGIPVPGDPDQVIYVWFDAVINYLAATGWPNDEARYRELWPADLHMVGKEIFVRFHATLWPAMLMALGLDLPKTVFAHGWWTDVSGQKGGKRTGGLPHPVEFANDIAELTGCDSQVAVDALRYLLLREMNFPGDTEFSRESFYQRYNADLANDLGNLCNRTVTMLEKYTDGVWNGESSIEPELTVLISEVRHRYDASVGSYMLHSALEEAWRLVAWANGYIGATAPWKLAKEGKAEEVERVLTSCLAAVNAVTTLAAPAMPAVAQRLREQIGVDALSTELMLPKEKRRVKAPEPLFPRIDLSKIAPENELKEPKPVSDTLATASPDAATAAPEVPLITIDDFMKVQLRVGNVLTAERVPNADKLLKLSVDLGDETRTILAGIAEMYEPDEVAGKQVVVVANLQPRKMRGIESQGMLLAADVNGQAILVQPETKVDVGSRVR